jgi:hypothetical protein
VFKLSTNVFGTTATVTLENGLTASFTAASGVYTIDLSNIPFAQSIASHNDGVQNMIITGV